jgi:hypothetical protein
VHFVFIIEIFIYFLLFIVFLCGQTDDGDVDLFLKFAKPGAKGNASEPGVVRELFFRSI